MTRSAPIALLMAFMLAMVVPAQAKVSKAKASELGKQLTPIGATRAGNKAGTIPAWQGASYFTKAEKTRTYKDMVRLWKEDPDKLNYMKGPGRQKLTKPLFTITSQNYKKYANHLTAGQKAMFAHYSDYKMIIYPSVRNAFFPKEIYKWTKYNATHATLKGTDGISDEKVGFPFPIPTNGAQVIWNHKLKFRGAAVTRYNNQAVVDADGSFSITKLIENVHFEYANLKLKPKDRNENMIFQYISRTLSPPRVAGQIILVHGIFGLGTSGRNAWIYNPGLGRVNRAPEVGYDNPSVGSDGLQFNDQIDMYNGSLSRYTWKLVGKKEIYIPYNSYKMDDSRVTYKDLIQPHHINQNLPRYELHRVWVVEATRKPNMREQIGRRVFYVDEDSWDIAMVDCYDNRNKLWKFQEGHIVTAPIVGTATTVPEVIYDLQSGRYFVTAMVTGSRPNDTSATFSKGYFSPRNLSRLGTKF